MMFVNVAMIMMIEIGETYSIIHVHIDKDYIYNYIFFLYFMILNNQIWTSLIHSYS